VAGGIGDCVVCVLFVSAVVVGCCVAGSCWGGVAGSGVRTGAVVCLVGTLVGEGSADGRWAGSGDLLTDCVVCVSFVRSVVSVGGVGCVCVLGVESVVGGKKFLCWCGDAMLLMKLLIVV
jgi:hypothetical protein